MTGTLTKNQTVDVYENHGQDSRVKDLGGTCSTVSAKYGTGGGNTPLIATYDMRGNGDGENVNCLSGHHAGGVSDYTPVVCVAGAVSAAGGTHQDTYIAKMVHWQQGGGEVEDNVSGALRANAEHSYQFARIQSTVRRLTPHECERLQGFPDDHTAVQYRNKPACDGPRYKALGNSMAVPCVEFILHNLLLTASSSRHP